MCQTRISGDVWQLALEVAQVRGLGNPRTAIEAIVRVYAASYMNCQQPTEQPIAASTPALKATVRTNEPTAQDSLSNLLSEL